jgi:hypothetical protein
MRAFVVSTVAAIALAVPAAASADGAVVSNELGSLDGTFHDLNICGWPATFTTAGRYQLESVMVDDIHGHFAYHEAVNWTLVVDDDPSVPAPFRGETWRGRNEESVVGNFDPLSLRGMFVRLNPFSEGPFHGLVEQLVFVRAEDGSVRVEKVDFVGEIDCAGLTT